MHISQLAASAGAGDPSALLPLWEQTRRFAWRQALRWTRAMAGRGGPEAEDLAQEAFLALMEAADRYNPARGPFLPWYALTLRRAFAAASGLHTQRGRRDPFRAALY